MSKGAVALIVARASKSTSVKDLQWSMFSVRTMKLQCVASVNPQVLSASFISLRSMVVIDLNFPKEEI